MGELPTAVLAVQATRFERGVAIGVTVHHAVADGRSLWTFAAATAPCFDRSLVNLPGGEELTRSVLRKFTPNLPSPCFLLVSRRTFTVGGQGIQRLKQRIVRLGEAPQSTFAAAVALAWACFARCKPFASDDQLLLFFFADVRDRLDPPVDAGRELRGERALAAAVRDEVRKMREVPVARWDFVTPLWKEGSMHRLMNVSGSPRFTAYEDADFGWGKPTRTEPIRMNHDGQVALMGAGDGHGGVQMSVSLLQPAQMDLFKSHFLDLLG
ncbi:hypothetical protein VPH35_040872 [Triticum aestivum]